MKLFLKLFAVLSVPFGLFMGLMVGGAQGLEAGVRIGVFQGLFFGCAMALFLMLVQRRECRRLGADADLSPWQTLSIEVTAESSAVVLARVKIAVEKFGAKILNENAGGASLRAKVRSSWKSFGEILECRVVEAGTHRFEIEITSRPRFRATVIDYGKGRENVEKLAQSLL